MTIHQLKEKGRDTTRTMNYCKIKERRKDALPFSLSLSIESPMVFHLLRVRLEGPKGDWGTRLKDPKEPWAEELIET